MSVDNLRTEMLQCMIHFFCHFHADIMVIINNDAENMSNDLFSNIILQILQSNNYHIYSIFIQSSKEIDYRSGHPTKFDGFILLYTNEGELGALFQKLAAYPQWNPKAKYLIYATQTMSRKEFLLVIEVVANFKLVNVLFVSLAEHFITTRVSFKIRCDQNGFEWIPIINNSPQNCVAMKIHHDVTGSCVFKVRTIVAPPKVMKPIKKISEEDKTYLMKNGVEIELFNELVKRLGVKASYSLSDIPTDYGNMYPNGSSSGAFKTLMDGKVDFIIGDLSMNDVRMKRLNYIEIKYMDRYVYCTLQAPLEPEWHKLKPLSSITLTLLILFTMTCVAIVTVIFVKVRKHSLDFILIFIVLWATILNMSVKLPKSSLLRLLLFLWGFLGMILYKNFQANVILLLSKDIYEKNIETIEEVIDRNLTVTIGPYVLNLVSEEALKPFEKQTVLLPTMQHCINNTLEVNGATIVTKGYVTYMHQIYADQKGRPRFHFLQDNLYLSYTYIYVKREAPFQEEMKKIVGRMNSGGIIQHWMKRVYWYDMNYEFINYNSYIKPNLKMYFKSMNLNVFAGVFVFLLVAHIIASFVFLFEMVAFKYVEVIQVKVPRRKRR